MLVLTSFLTTFSHPSHLNLVTRCAAFPSSSLWASLTAVASSTGLTSFRLDIEVVQLVTTFSFRQSVPSLQPHLWTCLCLVLMLT